MLFFTTNHRPTNGKVINMPYSSLLWTTDLANNRVGCIRIKNLRNNYLEIVANIFTLKVLKTDPANLQHGRTMQVSRSQNKLLINLQNPKHENSSQIILWILFLEKNVCIYSSVWFSNWKSNFEGQKKKYFYRLLSLPELLNNLC